MAALLDDYLQPFLPGHRLTVQNLPGTAVRLHLIDPQGLNRPLSPDQAQAARDLPGYWMFCWASGLVLARHLQAHPELVAGRRVVDLGCGSGVVAIAAARAGAAEVVALDHDPVALQATAANAALNGVDLTCLREPPPGQRFELALAADILYSSENYPLLLVLEQLSPNVLLAESLCHHLNRPGWRALGQVAGHLVPDLDGWGEFSRVSLFSSTR